MLKNYFYSGLFPMVYQYVKTVQSTYFINHKLMNKEEIDYHRNNLKIIFTKFTECGFSISQILGKNIAADLKEGFTIISDKNGTDSELLLKMSNENAGINKVASSIGRKNHEEKTMLNDRNTMTNLLDSNERNLKDMDEEEILYPAVYEIRKRAENLMHAIELSYPEELKHLISKYVRYTANKRDHIRNESNGIDFKFYQADKLMDNYKIDVNSKMSQKLEAERIQQEAALSKNMREFNLVIRKYKEEKEEHMEKKTDSNCTIQFLKKNQHQVGNTLSFILGTIYSSFKLGEEKDRSKVSSMDEDKKTEFNFDYGTDYIVEKFFENQYLYPYFIYLDNLISTYDEMKHAMFYILSDTSSEVDRSAPVWQEAHDNLFSPQLKKIINTPERKAQNKKVLSIIYYLYTQLGQFCTFKSYQDNTWSQVWDRFFVMGSVIKNLSEDNANYFKLYLGGFKPTIASDNTFNPGGYSSLVFDSFVRLESLTNLSLNWYNTSTKLSYYDRPEISIHFLIWFDFVTEFVTGPCPKNQRSLYRYKTSNWIGIMMRELDDVNSVFYSVKNKCIDYVLGLIEGEGVYPLTHVSEEEKKEAYQCSKWMSASITPSNVLTMMYRMIKRLVIYRKMTRSAAFKNKLLKKVQKNRQKKHLFEQSNGIKTAD